jgi:hypothetical protein
MENSLGGAAEGQPRKAGAPLRSNHNELGARVVSGRYNHLRRRTTNGKGFPADLEVPKALLQPQLGGGLQIRENVEHRRGRAAAQMRHSGNRRARQPLRPTSTA